MLQNQQYKQQYQQQGQLMQEVSPDFFIPDFNEDLHKADERIDQHTQDKHIQRDDEGDNKECPSWRSCSHHMLTKCSPIFQ